jgi:large subunit ribosomal protein L7/L12
MLEQHISALFQSQRGIAKNEYTNPFTRKKGCCMATSKLEKLNQKREQLNAQIQAIKAKEASQKRKDDTRRKVLIGGVVIKMINNGEMPQKRIDEILDKHLERSTDRALFNLPERIKKEEKLQTLEQELIGT